MHVVLNRHLQGMFVQADITSISITLITQRIKFHIIWSNIKKNIMENVNPEFEKLGCVL